MKTRAEDQRTAMQEALEMLQKGRPADAQETLSAALDAPTDDRPVRDAALEEAVDSARIARPPERMSLSGRDKVVFNTGVRAAVERIRALQSAPAQVVSVAKVREVLNRAAVTLGRQGYGAGIVRDISKALGLDLDAAPAKVPTPSTARHWINDVQECSGECPACNENRARGLNPDGTTLEGSR